MTHGMNSISHHRDKGNPNKIAALIRLFYILLAGQADVANAGYVQLAHLVMNSQIIGFIETQTRGSKQKVWNLNHYTMKLD